jgi:hypothetical protein
MSFAKVAADQLFSPDEEAARQAKRQRWLHLLGTVGTLGAAAGGAYYMGKNHGEHWNNLMEGASIKAPDAPPAPSQVAIDRAVGHIGLPPGHLGAEGLGVALGYGAGWKAPGFIQNKSVGNLLVNGADAESPVAKNLGAIRGAKPGGVESMLSNGQMAAAGTTPAASVDAAPGRAIDSLRTPKASPTKASTAALLKALGNGKSISPVSTYTGLNPIKAFNAYRDMDAVQKGLGVAAGGRAGEVRVTPNGEQIPVSEVNKRVVSETGLPPARVRSFLDAQRGQSGAANGLKGIVGQRGLSGLFGAYLGSQVAGHYADQYDVAHPAVTPAPSAAPAASP